MNTLVKYIGIALAGFALASCSVDNYEQPNSWLHGAAIYSPDGGEPEYIEQDLLTTNGTQLVVTELDFVDKFSGNAAATTTNRTLNFKTDGSYSDKGFFAGKYKIKADICNFFPFEDEITVPKGDYEYNIDATPYVRVLIDSLFFNETECNVYAYFKLECPDPSVTVKEAALFVDQNANVSKSMNGAGDNGCKISIGKTPDPEAQYRLKMSTKYMSPVPGHFYFRVGALADEKQATYNYAKAQKMYIDNSMYVEPPVVLPGVQIDACDSADGWGGDFAGLMEDHREGTGSVGKTKSGSFVVLFQKVWATPIDLQTTIKAGHVKFWYYISDLAAMPTSGAGYSSQFEFCSGGGCDNQELTLEFNKLSLNAGWNEIDVPMSQCANGGFNPNAFNYFRHYNTLGNGDVTIAIDDLRAYAPDVMDTCDSVDGWGSGLGAAVLDYDCREGEACVSFTGNTSGVVLAQKKYDTPFNAPVTADSGQFAFYMYISDGAALPQTNQGQIELCSGGNCDIDEVHWDWSMFPLSTGWNKIALPISKGADRTKCNYEACNFIRMYHTGTAGVDITLKLDKIGFYVFPED